MNKATDKVLMVTPNIIDVMLHCHCSSAPHPRQYAPAVADALKFLLDNKMIEASADSNGENYVSTKRGKAWVAMLCTTPFPVAVYMDPRLAALEAKDLVQE